MLLGREREREALRGVLDAARGGRSGSLALVGDPGVGKSALLDWTAGEAAGMSVLRARGVPAESRIPFAGLFALLRPALSALDAIPEPQAAALGSALALRPPRAADRFAVGAATLSLLAAHAEASPVALLVDDAHWLDGASADALLFAVRRLLADPVAVVVAVRSGERSLLDAADLPALEVGGLDADDALALLRREAPAADDAALRRLWHETGGNPLALLELARRPAAHAPPEVPLPVAAGLAETFVRRLRELPERTRDLLVLAAASGTGDLGVLARAASAYGLELRELAPAEEAGLVALGEALEFRHPLARAGVYADAAPERRRRAHRALADALPDADADRRAWHLALAAVGPDAAASSALEQAGARARARSAYDAASRAYERAALLSADLRRRASLLHRAADAAWLAGLAARAEGLLREAGRLAGDERLALEIEALRGHVALCGGHLSSAREILGSAAARAGAGAADLAVVMLAEAAQAAFYAADADGVRECGERARGLVAYAGDERSTFFARMTAGIGAVLSGSGADGASSIREAVAVLDRSSELEADPRLLVWAALGPLFLREGDVGRERLDRAVAAARRAAAVGALPHLLEHAAIEHAAGDRWVEAQAAFDEAVALARQTGQRTVLALALARLALLEARLGRASGCSAHAGEALELARTLGIVLAEIWALGALGELALARGETEAALARFDEQQSAIDGRALADVDLRPGPERVELLLRLGRRDEAAAAAEGFARAAADKGQPWALARAARARAELAPEEESGPLFAEALSLHALTPDVFEAARTRLAYGRRLRRGGLRARAREELRAALAVFDALGAAPWAELARAEHAATGETARRRDPGTLDELTPQELAVGLLLAEGRTTREAAAALFLSPKTVEYHLRNAYRKLAIRSREELARALRREGVEPPGAAPTVGGEKAVRPESEVER